MFKLLIERNLYDPSPAWLALGVILAPLSLLYTLIVCIKRLFAKPQKFKIPIISVGNLTLGGSGKTPLVRALFKEFNGEFKTCIILRGYGRKSRGLLEVALGGRILCDVEQSGDEAMEYALFLRGANVIVSEDRAAGILRAQTLGFELVILDDGFSKFNISKFDILLRPQSAPKLPFCLPFAAYRYPPFFYKFADFIPAPSDIAQSFKIVSAADLQSKLNGADEILNPADEISNFAADKISDSNLNRAADKISDLNLKTAEDKISSPKEASFERSRTILISAIAKPWRLERFLPLAKAHAFFPDHYDFKKEQILELLRREDAEHILCTAKDYVKLRDLSAEISVILLNLKLSENFIRKIQNYINQAMIK
ncbi:tetraacyldisaccharide 4'-kinase [Campylobacter gracilis]|uniref:Tetraacyldisaccharide 4'-kinase n=1 Tax=Campylobacter gracilis RM3268 TaxID=553220 RepID=C8PJ52_9BACT|nr:tetraacyldisaccharide 4'-kinase [Campylobacter gracilis]AKT92362.1 tetraacyldisaccharide 4'-kinase [Campylobacter gracilis]EEV16957.1 tetraacyldisaccharide 4'-kinase [Campylobacter gracilis RM3268]UEB45452.1 tetraacyldisaccharide 4'-kinase [Campylobacter gracilis]SUW81882.1 tetraacyldisaccharide 4'-kinase [Campylobacter gracilis]